jgi:uncharacterized membrane protein YphA (DoxX/SURF4 family)
MTTKQLATIPPAVTTRPPALIHALLALPGLEIVARLALASPFIMSGATKLLNFDVALSEAAALGLTPPALVAVAVIITQIGGAVLFLNQRWCWLGAGILAGFTLLATLIAHPFWTFDEPDRGRQTATFLEHVGLAGGFLIAALLAHRAGAGR